MNILAFYRLACRWFVYWTLILGTALAMTLFWRRMAGGFLVMSWQLPLVILIFVCLSAVLRGAVAIAFNNEYKTCQRIGLFLVPVELLFLCGVCRPEAMPEFYLSVIIAFLFHYVFWFWGYDDSSAKASSAEPSSAEIIKNNAKETSADALNNPEDSPEEFDEDYLESLFPSDVYQQWTRQTGAEGEDVQTGWFRVSFAAQQKHASVNAAFCPPFQSVPETELEIIDGSDLTASVGVCYPHGARIDLTLATPSPLEQTVLVRFTAKCAK